MSDQEQMLKLYRESEWFIASSVTLTHGEVHLFDLKYDGGRIDPRHTEVTSLADILKKDLGHSSLDPLVSARWENLLIRAGEGSYGGEGFVSVYDEALASLKWFAYFEESNPFTKVEVKDGHVIATTNLDQLWSFPLDAPHKFTVRG